MSAEMARVGVIAPDFSLLCTQGPGTQPRRVSLSTFRGSWLTLMFYPRDFSMVCPTELTALSTRYQEFRQRECELLGISTDSIASHERWIAAPRSQGGLGGLQFPLGADEDGAVSKTFGVYLPKQHIALRGLFILDPNGVLQYQVVHNLSVGRRSEEILRVLDGLQSGGLCPEDWSRDLPTLDPAESIREGSVVGNYRIEGVLGKGSFGAVFRARDQVLHRTVAIKIMRSGKEAVPAALLSEARAAAALNHANVCTIFSVDNSEGLPVIAMEYVDGHSLQRILEAGPIPQDHAAIVIRQIAQGMTAAHEAGIIHGDLKPANIMVSHEGTVKVMDFGIARRAKPATNSQDTLEWEPGSAISISGTPSYMSPEQARGAKLSTASDVFSLGLVMYEILTGYKAIVGNNVLDILHQIEHVRPERYAAAIPEPYATLVRKALHPHPDGRDIAMHEIATALG